MFRSDSGKGEGTSDPDSVYVEELHDENEGENWLRIDWNGAEYEDAWIMDRSENVEDLEDNK